MINNEMSLYSINKASMSQIEPYDGIALNRLCYKIAKWMLEEEQANYYMLLSNEKRNYTVFDLSGEATIDSIKNDLIECFHNRGEVTDITLQEDGKYEIWLRKDGEDFLYYLFNYDWGVLTY